MSGALSAFAPISEAPGIWTAQKGTLRCTALRLRDGTLCLYSPVLGLGQDAKSSLERLGDVSALLAPNHYHHKGLREYADAFPDARIVASARATPRLEAQTGLSFQGPERLATDLPKGCKLVEPDGLKTGEVWVEVDTKSDLVWIVCDSFKGPKGKIGHRGPCVEMLGTFPTYAVANKESYTAWVMAKLNRQAPTVIVPCHGSMIQSSHLAADISALLA